MAKFKGSSLVVSFAGTDISGAGRSFEVSEDPGEAEKIDVTVRGDSEREFLEGFPGGDNTTVSMTALALDGSDTIEPIATNTTGTLLCYPEGTAHGAIKVTVSAARLISKTYTVPYDGAVEWALSFNSVNAATYGTHST